MRKGSGRWVFGRCSHLGLHMAGCAMKQVISRYVGVGTRLFVTCLRESVENDGPDMEGPRQRGETVIAGETESRQEGLGWACIVWQYMEPLAVGIDMRRSSSLGAERKDSGELRMGDGGGRASNHPGWTRFSTRRLVAVGASIPAIRLARNIQCIIIIARSILYIPLMTSLIPDGYEGFTSTDVTAGHPGHTPPRIGLQMLSSSSPKPVQRTLQRWQRAGGSQKQR